MSKIIKIIEFSHSQTCHHEWKSARGVAKCEIVVNQVGDGIRQGEIFVRLYGQQCKRCATHVNTNNLGAKIAENV